MGRGPRRRGQLGTPGDTPCATPQTLAGPPSTAGCSSATSAAACTAAWAATSPSSSTCATAPGPPPCSRWVLAPRGHGGTHTGTPPAPTGPCLSPADGAHLGEQRGQLHLGALAAGSGPGAERAPEGKPPGQSAVSAPHTAGRGSAPTGHPSPRNLPPPPQPHQVGVHPCQVPDAGLRPQAALPG